jgi:hypothetical protein
LPSESDYQIGRAAALASDAVMCVTSLVTASEECQNGTKSCKAGKRHRPGH